MAIEPLRDVNHDQNPQQPADLRAVPNKEDSAAVNKESLNPNQEAIKAAQQRLKKQTIIAEARKMCVDPNTDPKLAHQLFEQLLRVDLGLKFDAKVVNDDGVETTALEVIRAAYSVRRPLYKTLAQLPRKGEITEDQKRVLASDSVNAWKYNQRATELTVLEVQDNKPIKPEAVQGLTYLDTLLLTSPHLKATLRYIPETRIRQLLPNTRRTN